MAHPRSSPYLYATWLAKVMAGQVTCQWQYWFQVHNKLMQRQPDSYDLVGWRIDHARMVNELRLSIKARGETPRLAYHFKLEIPDKATLGGEADCIVANRNQVTVYDCKTGQPRASDQVQVMIYMHALAQEPAFRSKAFQGAVLYKDGPVAIPRLPETFVTNFCYFVDLLASKTPPHKSSGSDCKFCAITSDDCDEREGAAAPNDQTT